MPDVVYCFDANYATQFGVSVCSLIQNMRSGHADLTVHIVSDSFDADFLRRLDILKGMFRVGFRTYELNEKDLGQITGFPVHFHFTRATYMRLLLPSVLPEDITRVLYLDADTIILDDVSKLLAQDLAGCAIGAVRGFSSKAHAARLQIDDAINSGVMLMDLAQWRRRQIAEACFRWLGKNATKAELVDQDAVNVVASGSIHFLDPRWNFQVKSGQDAHMEDPAIIHYLATPKPWHEWYDNGFGKYYVRYAQTSPWKDIPFVPPKSIHEVYQLALFRLKEGKKAEASLLYERVVRSLQNELTRQREATAGQKNGQRLS